MSNDASPPPRTLLCESYLYKRDRHGNKNKWQQRYFRLFAVHVGAARLRPKKVEHGNLLNRLQNLRAPGHHHRASVAAHNTDASPTGAYAATLGGAERPHVSQRRISTTTSMRVSPIVWTFALEYAGDRGKQRSGTTTHARTTQTFVSFAARSYTNQQNFIISPFLNDRSADGEARV
jgi:hypothetical protein